jgi:3-oxoacyl-[acyl-carrier protein] reductase
LSGASIFSLPPGPLRHVEGRASRPDPLLGPRACPSNIRVNAVSPGAIPTELERKHYRQGRAAFDQWVIDRQSLPFRSDIRDVADTVLYLLSPLSRFMTGQELHVNGGMYMG